MRDGERRSFHMPGHHGGPGAPGEGVDLLGPAPYAADVSELGGFDYLHGPRSAIVAAQAEAARVFGADRTFFLVNGSTVGNLAAIMATASDGHELVLQRASHRSSYAGLVLSGARPRYLEPLRNEAIDLLAGADPNALEQLLRSHPEIGAVHVTSPSFYGFTVPVAEIAAVTATYEVALIVDEAHGTHFVFHEDFPTPALAAGADASIQSAHKTLGSLTQSSLLHLRGDRIDAGRVEQALGMLQSSSPSALLLVSLDVAIAEAATAGRAAWNATLRLARSARDAIGSIPGLAVYGDELVGTPGISGYDPTKLVVDVSGLGTTGLWAESWLARERGLNAEFSDLRRVVFSFAPGVVESDVAMLLEALAALAAGADPSRPAPSIGSRWPAEVPEMVVTPRVGFSAPVEAVPVDQAPGRVVAEMIVPYPPGVPLLVQGERITPSILASVRQLREAGSSMVGMADATGSTIRCIVEGG